MQDQNVLTVDAVKNDVLSHGKTAQIGTQVFIASASKIRMVGKKKKSVSDGVNYAVGNLKAALSRAR